MERQQMESILEAVSQANPAALSVCAGLLRVHEGGLLIAQLLAQGITGAEVWLLYKNGCDEEFATMRRCLRDGTTVQRLQGVRDSKFYKPEEETTT